MVFIGIMLIIYSKSVSVSKDFFQFSYCPKSSYRPSKDSSSSSRTKGMLPAQAHMARKLSVSWMSAVLVVVVFSLFMFLRYSIMSKRSRGDFIFLNFLFWVQAGSVPSVDIRHSGIVPSCNSLISNHLRARGAPKSLIFSDLRVIY